jgi:hypothetical protein
MPNRYWVGGTANWDGTAGTKWAETSGGPGGLSVPTTADDVFFDSNSTGTVTIAVGNTGAKSINCTGFTGTITGTNFIEVAGSVTLNVAMTYTHTGTVRFTAAATIISAGKQFSTIEINAPTSNTVALGDALNTSTRNITVSTGIFDTAGFSLTTNQISSLSASPRTINLNSSTVTLVQNGTVINFNNLGSLTFNPGTSQINATQTNPAIIVSGGGVTFYDVSFTSTSSGVRSLSGINTFNNLTFTPPFNNGVSTVSLSDRQTINGTLNCSSASISRRIFIRSNIIGISRILDINSISANNSDFRDITVTGSAEGSSPTNAGDCGGNSGINFPASKTVYRVGTNTTWAGSSSWALSSGGTGSDNNFPLVQDTAVINGDTALTGSLSFITFNIGSLDCSNRTTGITLLYNVSCIFYGNYTLGSGVTVSGNQTQVFSGRGTQILTTAGKTITFAVIIDKPTDTFELSDALNSTNFISLTRGGFDAKSYNVTCSSFISSNSNIRNLNMGSGLWTLSGTGSVWNTAVSTNFTFNKDTSNILLSNTSTSQRTFGGGSLTYNKLTIGGATGISTLLINNQSTFSEIDSIKTVAHTISIDTTSITNFGIWNVKGSPGNVVNLNSSSVGTRRTVNITNATSGIDYLSVADIGIANPDRFYVGSNSTDGGNNLNVIFTDAPSTGSTSSMFFVFF